MMLSNAEVSTGVVPALMVAYSEADAVEGLDVDKYHFDKFTMRHNVDTVLRELWKDERCLMGLMAMAAPDHAQCVPFVLFFVLFVLPAMEH